MTVYVAKEGEVFHTYPAKPDARNLPESVSEIRRVSNPLVDITMSITEDMWREAVVVWVR